jgi:hypothetical protein
MASLLSLVVNGVTRLNNDTHGKNVYADKHITNGGSNLQFVKGDGSLDNTLYAKSSDLRNYLLLAGGIMTGTISFVDSGTACIRYATHTATGLGNYPLPNTGTGSIGIFARASKSTDEGGIIISEDTCLVHNSGDVGWNFQVHNTDLSQKNFSGTNGDGAATRAFGVTDASSYVWSRGGFQKNGSSDSYVLLGGGGHKALSDFSMSHDHPYLPLAGGWMDTGAQIYFKGLNQSTSVWGSIGYRAASGNGSNAMHTVTTSNNTGALYITTNGYDSANDYGGLAIDNDGVTVLVRVIQEVCSEL